MANRKYGWKRPSKPSAHPLFLPPPHLLSDPLPAKVDLRQYDAPIADQRQMGECTGEALAGLAGNILARDAQYFAVSSLAIYYWERELEGTTQQDSGANLSDGMSVLQNRGCPPSGLWPDEPRLLYFMPSTVVVTQAAKHRLLDPESVPQDLTSIKTCLAQGKPVVVGIDVYESFESDRVAQTGIIPMPGDGEIFEGGHAMVLVGYDDSLGGFIDRNSWGVSWGQLGYCMIPYDYILNPKLCSDLHTGSRIS